MGRSGLTELEFMVIAAVFHAGEDAYGVRIAEELEARTGRDIAIGTLYRTLNRLEKQGLLESRLGEATPERGGRAKTFYAVRAKGKREFLETTGRIRSILEGLTLTGGLA